MILKNIYIIYKKGLNIKTGENIIILKILIIHESVVSEFLMLVTLYDLVYKGISNINKQFC